LVVTVEFAAQMKQERDSFEKRCNELQQELEATKAESARVIEAVQSSRDKREESLAAKLRVDIDSLTGKKSTHLLC
jgi:uncharacterized coiled-coil DUF342 family protein